MQTPFLLLADAQNPGGGLGDAFNRNTWMLIIGGIVCCWSASSSWSIFFSFVRLWIQCFLTGAKISIWDLVGMKLRNVDYAMIVRQKIALVQAGVKVSTQEMEAHYLSRGNVPKTATAVIAAHKAGIDLPWRTAAAIDLAGRDVLDAVKTSVNPKVIDCPDPDQGPADARRRLQERHPAQGPGPRHGADQARPPGRRRHRGDHHRPRRRGHRQGHRLAPSTTPTCWPTRT